MPPAPGRGEVLSGVCRATTASHAGGLQQHLVQPPFHQLGIQDGMPVVLLESLLHNNMLS